MICIQNTHKSNINNIRDRVGFIAYENVIFVYRDHEQILINDVT